MTDRHKTRKILKTILISFFVIFIFGYTFYEIQKVIFGPKLVILQPINGSIVSESLVKITGQSKNIQKISLNDRDIFIDEQGNFNEEILLSYGYNILTLKANDKFGRKTEKTLEIIYK
jgi:hypothetical protein